MKAPGPVPWLIFHHTQRRGFRLRLLHVEFLADKAGQRVYHDSNVLCSFIYHGQYNLSKSKINRIALPDFVKTLRTDGARNSTDKSETGTYFTYRGADKSLARQGRKQANVSVRTAWISFGALQCRKKTWQLASRCCWNHARPWHASELVFFLVRLRTDQHPGRTGT